jgi:hypothetical protein
MRYHFTPVRLTINKSVGEDVEKRKALYTVEASLNYSRYFGEQYGASS